MGPIVWSQSDIRDRYLPRCTMHGQHIDLFRRAAPHVDRILRGAKPCELPVQVPFKYEMTINLKTAKALSPCR